MSLTNVVCRNQFTGNGATTSFPTGFEFLENSDISVLLTAAGITTTLTQGTDYTVFGVNNPAGGTVACSVAPASGVVVTIVRTTPLTQSTTFIDNDALPASSLENGLDKLTMALQELQSPGGALTRAIQFPVTEPTTTSGILPVASVRAGNLLGFDVLGNFIATLGLGQPRGLYVPGTAYAARDLVSDSNQNLYTVFQAFTATTLSADIASGNLVLIINSSAIAAAVLAQVSMGTTVANFTNPLAGDVTGNQTTTRVGKINGVLLSGLATGLLKNTTSTGVPTIAVANTDYLPATAGSNILAGNGSGGVANVSLSGLTYSGGTLSVSAASSDLTIRQTVLSGPVDVNGLPIFLPSTSGSLSLTAQNVSTGSSALVVTSANGFGAAGAVSSIGVYASNPTWSGLAASSTNYLYFTVSGGVLTPGSTTLAPIYQVGGTPSTTNGQFTFNINQMIGYMGTGSSAPQANIVFVGEAVTSAGTVTSTVAYAYNGRFDSGYISTLPAAGTQISKASALGTTLAQCTFVIQNSVAEFGYSPGDVINNVNTNTGSYYANIMPTLGSRGLNVTFTTSTGANFGIINKTSGVSVAPTAANWQYRIYAIRSF